LLNRGGLPAIWQIALHQIISASLLIWLNADGDAHTVVLKVGKAADRFEEQTGRAKRLTVCVPQPSLSIEVKNVLETRFGKIRYSVTAADFLGRKEDLRMPAESIASGIMEPVLRAEVGAFGTMTRKQDSQ
jgi:hypothetical protein